MNNFWRKKLFVELLETWEIRRPEKKESWRKLVEVWRVENGTETAVQTASFLEGILALGGFNLIANNQNF